MADSSEVNIKVTLTDQGVTETAQKTTAALDSIGNSGAEAGKKMQAGMAGVSTAAKRASVDVDNLRARQQSLINQLNAWQQQRTANTPMGIFNEQVGVFSKQGLNALDAQERAMQRTKVLLEEQRVAAMGAGRGYGEMRVAMGAVTGNVRQMEMGIATLGGRLTWLQPLFAAAFAPMMALGAAAILVQMGEAVYQLYEKWLDVDGAIQQYNDKAAEAAEKEFDKNRSFEQVNAGLKLANDQLDALNRKKANSPGVAAFPEMFSASMLLEGGNYYAAGADLARSRATSYFSTGDAKKLNQAKGQSDADKYRKEQLDHLARVADLRNKATEAEARATTAMGRAAAKRKAADEEEDERIRHLIADQNLLHQISVDAGKKQGDVGFVPAPGTHDFDSERSQARARADAQYYASSVENARRNAEEIARIREQATESGLKGYALISAQETHALDELKRKGIATAEAVADTQKIFHDRRMNDLHQEMEALTAGIGKEIADGDRAHRMITERLGEIADRNAGAGQSGFARIQAEGNRQTDEWTRFAKEHHASQAEVDRGVGMIGAGTAAQSAALARRNAEETEQIEQQARMRGLSDEKQQSAAIEAEYENRVRKWKEALDQQEISQQDFNRRVVAAAAERDAEIDRQAREEHAKMASEFSSFFRSLDHPLQALQEYGAKAAGDFAATMAQKIEAHQRGKSGGATRGGGFFDGIMAHAHLPGMPELGTHSTAPAESAKMMALQTATIQIGQANVQFGATMGGNFGTPFAGGGTRGGMNGGYGFSPAVYSTSGSTGASGGGAGYGYTPGFSGSDGSTLSFGAPASGSGSGVSDASYSGGGAGSAPASSTATAGASAPGFAGPGAVTRGVPGGALATSAGNIGKGIGLFSQAKGIFGAKGSGGISDSDLQQLAGGENGPNANGTFAAGGAGSGASGGAMGQVMGGVNGAVGLYSAYEGNGGVGGALSGAMSGMQLGMMVAGPMGAAIGAAAGAIIGAIGFGGREKARVYDLKQLRPRLNNDVQAFQTGQMDYLGAYTDVQSALVDARTTVTKWGPGANSYYQDTMKPEVSKIAEKLTREQKAGRGASTFSAAQFDVGGPIGGFGSMMTGPDSGWIHAQRGEFMVHQQAAIPHYQALQAINSGASHSDMSRYYGSREGQVAPAEPSSITHNVTIHAVDSKSFADMVAANPMSVRRALNLSNEHYSGAADV